MANFKISSKVMLKPDVTADTFAEMGLLEYVFNEIKDKGDNGNLTIKGFDPETYFFIDGTRREGALRFNELGYCFSIFAFTSYVAKTDKELKQERIASAEATYQSELKKLKDLNDSLNICQQKIDDANSTLIHAIRERDLIKREIELLELDLEI